MSERTSGGLLTYSEVESKRFGFSTYRAEVEELEGRALVREVFDRQADLVILRIPTARRGQWVQLERWGLPCLPADTLVHYALDFSSTTDRQLRNRDLDFVPCTESLLPVLDDLVKEIFEGYRNHYGANPHLAGFPLVDGYQEWVRGFADPNDPSREVWLAQLAGRSAGFCSCRDLPGSGQGEGVLFGVSPWAAGRGIYTDMIRFAQGWCRGRGRGGMTVSTQVENLAVQKVWSREGFVLAGAVDTVHVNAFLTHSTLPEVSVPLRFDVNDIRDFAQVSGDRNSIHLDPEAARQAGFDGPIVHGAALEAELSRILGTITPGTGTVYLGSSVRFLAPVYRDRDYRMVVRYPHVTGRHVGFVAQVKDEEGGLCFLSRGDLLLRRPASTPPEALPHG